MKTKMNVFDVRPAESEALTGHFWAGGILQANDYRHFKEQKQKEHSQRSEMMFTFLCFHTKMFHSMPASLLIFMHLLSNVVTVLLGTEAQRLLS